MKSKLKERLWEEISTEIALQSGTEAKTMWEKLRHSLRDALRRQKQALKSGTAATTLKLWRFQAQMSFLQPYMVNRKQETNLHDESEDTQTTQSNQHHNLSDCEDTQQDTQQTGATWEVEQQEDQVSRESTPGPQHAQTTYHIEKRRKESVASVLKQAMEKREKRASERATERAALLDRMQPPNDPLYHFFMSMYETTKNMPLSSQHIVKNSIYQTVTGMEASLLGIPEICYEE